MIFIMLPIMLGIVFLFLFYNGRSCLSLLSQFTIVNSRLFWMIFIISQFIFIALQFIPSKYAALIGGYFLGFTFYYFLIGIMLDLIKLFGVGDTGIKIIEISKVMITLVILIIGAIHANKIVVKNYDIEVNKVTENLNIVMFSDIHLGYLIKDSKIKEIVDKVNELEPDLVIIPGDFFDGAFSKTANIDTVKDDLRRINSKYGVYVSLGNHDLVKDREAVEKFFIDSNITLLKDEHITINNITIIGRYDDTPIDSRNQDRKELKDLLSETNNDNVTILLDHKPTGIENATELSIDLLVCGHTHKGQLFPAELVTNMLFKLDYGYKKYDNTNVIVTSGVGYWGIPVRVFTNSEIVNIHLKGTK